MTVRLALPILLAVAALALALPARSGDPAPSAAADDGYRGAGSCRPCHREAYEEWRDSAHARSTQLATAETLPPEIVEGGTIAHPPGESRFSRGGDRFFIHTVGADGRVHRYPITHVVGPSRLHMYLTRLKNGRLQVLPLLKDLPANEFFDYTKLIFSVPDAAWEEAPVVRPGEPSFWTGPIRAFDVGCGRCHTSGRGEQVVAGDGSGLKTEWDPLAIDCEACHGPGAEHNEFWRRQSTGEFEPPAKDPIVSWFDLDREQQQSMCLWCHMEGDVVQTGFRPGDDVFEFITPTLLDHVERIDASGSPRELIYDGLPFLFSRCAEEGGLTCVTCHDSHGSPHRSDLLTDPERTFTLCIECHGDIAAKAREHSHHDMEKSGGRCVSCHMPFLTIERGHGHVRDHTIGNPMPDLPGGRAATDACTWCHTGGRGAPDDAPRLDGEAIRKAYREWYPDAGLSPSWVAAIAGGRDGKPDALYDLAGLAADEEEPRLVRASAAKLLGKYGRSAVTYLVSLISDRDSLVRRSAAAALAGVRHPDADLALSIAVRDESLAVRSAAARAALSGWSRVRENRALLEAILPVLEEEASVQPRDDLRWFRLGAARQLAGDVEGAVAAYERKLALDPYAVNVKRTLERLRPDDGR